MEKVPLVAEQREILLVPFPFSDFSGNKVRPVLVISNSNFNKLSHDIIVCAITTNTEKSDYSILITNKELEKGQLHSICAIKVESILRIDKRMIIKKIGKLKGNTFVTVMKKLHSLF